MDTRPFSLGNPRRRPAEPAQPELALPVDPLSVPIPPRAGWSQVDRNTLAWVHPLLGWSFFLLPERYPGTGASIYPVAEDEYRVGGVPPYVYSTMTGATRRLTASGVHLGNEFVSVNEAIEAIRHWYGSLRYEPVAAHDGAGARANGAQEATMTFGEFVDRYGDAVTDLYQRRRTTSPPMVWTVSHKYLAPSPAGPFQGTDRLAERPSVAKGDTVSAAFGRAVVTSVGRARATAADKVQEEDPYDIARAMWEQYARTGVLPQELMALAAPPPAQKLTLLNGPGVGTAANGAGHAARSVAPARGTYVRAAADHNHLGPGVVTYDFNNGEALVYHHGVRIFERHAPGTLVRAIRPRWLDHITVEARPRDVGGWQLTVGADGREVAVLNVRDAREALDVADRFALGSVGDGALTARVFVEGREVSARTRDDGGTRGNGRAAAVQVGASVDASDPYAGPGFVASVAPNGGVVVYHPKLQIALWRPAARVAPAPWPEGLADVDVNAWEDGAGRWRVTMSRPGDGDSDGETLAEAEVGGEADAQERAEEMARGALASGAAEASVYDSGLLVRYLQPER